MKEAVIVSAARTPVGRCRGKLAGADPLQLGVLAVKAAVERAGIDPAEIEDLVFGNLANCTYTNIARVIALEAGFPESVTAFTVDRQCSSGLYAIALAAMMIESGHGEVFVAGGVESDSNRTYFMEKPKQAYQVAAPKFVDPYSAPPSLSQCAI